MGVGKDESSDCAERKRREGLMQRAISEGINMAMGKGDKEQVDSGVVMKRQQLSSFLLSAPVLDGTPYLCL